LLPPGPRNCTMTVKTKTTEQLKECSNGDTAKTYTPVERELIAARAYEIWKERGCTHGYHEEDWLRAEADLLKESSLS